MTDTARSSPLFTARQLKKSFGEVEVLHGVDIDIRSGEVLALLGENGAGKSTLVKIIAGFEAPTSGELRLCQDDGSELLRPESWNNEVAESRGVVLIHQELNLAEQLSVADNIFLGHELRRGLLLDQRRMGRLARDYLKALDCEVDSSTAVSALPVSVKQMVEIAKAYARHSRLLILDEPTAVLTGKESGVLFELIRRLRQEGVAIVYISHKLDEIEQIADRIVILRDGELVGSYGGQELSKDDMARLMVGRELSTLFPAIPKPPADTEVVLKLEHGNIPGVIERADFSLFRGEILGFAGLVGSGRTALMEAIVGLRRFAPATTLHIHGETVSYKSLAAARDDGVAYLTKDRKGSGLILNMNLPFNFSLFSLSRFSRLLIDEQRERREFEAAVQTFDIRFKDSGIDAGNLSGGNQQKLLLAKLMAAEPGIIIVDEPTRGIDIGTKSQIYHFIAELAASGHAVILVSSDILEIIGLSHRVAVMCRGELAGILEDDEIEEHEIMRYATGLKTRHIQEAHRHSA